MKRLLRVLAILALVSFALAQSDVIVPNENLVAEGIPKIPAALAESSGVTANFAVRPSPVGIRLGARC